MPALNVHKARTVLVAQFNREKPLNPLNRELEQGIVETCRWAQAEPAIRAIVLTGGVDRSFGVGDDLNEAREIKTPAGVEDLIDRTIGLYVAILSVTKPIVAGIDGYAIGAGLQIALCCDWRVGTAATKALGWELKQGLACPIGAYMLRKSFGRSAMSDVIFGCEVVPPDWALEHKFFNEIAERQDVVERAIWRAGVLGEYPQVAYQRTKESVNRSFIGGLEELKPMAKDIILDGFRSSFAQAHFARITQRKWKP
ncbi:MULTISPECIES: enoyl-CoA hydratase/isomerase family protein [unclassified Bradyrhizobium]|uniref:enoyl-CoA hydratase/isomerase family protein n=1 Tax=unclassified Bradyrhizobium TaxID=2631580 RepID=UPI0024790747|nr:MULTISPECIES: enoyl-CoA hydratase/isomerase family protein [unclassified Bradyrhizobium]WGS19166.1 enoyl-CoA hydratase/isomerase family protein [Bradyrhizobium sp. ISRA463]WGS26003.1 enoyl-CoA hydratase/isomerase family protein [Bradyrhizobium sp. ISRA464]